MRTRIQYNGGANQEGRMNADKLKSLKKAMLYSYQAATAILEDGREFRCLMNPDKLTEEYDKKIVSIPFEDICVGIIEEQENELTGEIEKIEKTPAIKGKTSENYEKIGLKIGDVFEWKETQSKWIVMLQHLEETAYFRAEVYKCEDELDINGKRYWYYLRRPYISTALWNTKDSVPISWNDLNYTARMYIQNTEETREYFKRFKVIELFGQPWEVQAVDPITVSGIMTVALKETYKNTIQEQEEERKAAMEDNTQPDPDEETCEQLFPHIEGDTIVYPYDEKVYKVINCYGGKWRINNKRAIITKQTDTEVNILIAAGRSGQFKLIYERMIEDNLELDITIDSF